MSITIWYSVDELTQPTKQAAERDDGTTTWVVVPSLWDQSSIALFGSAEPGMTSSSTTASERSVIDATLMELRADIGETTRDELVRLGTTYSMVDGRYPAFRAAEIRTLASKLISTQAELYEWEYRFDSWARMLSSHLHVEHVASPLRLRNTPCPNCGTRQVVITTDGERIVYPALVIVFRNGLVRNAECSSCGQQWPRGDQLYELAECLL